MMPCRHNPPVRSCPVKPTDDFQVTGTGDNAAWKAVEWTPLQRRQADGHPYDTRFKVLYSKTGLYFLMEATDRKLTATMTEDFMHLWTEDVFEVFLWTDERYPVYLRIRDLAAQPRAADPDSEFRRPVPRLASLGLRKGSRDTEGDQHHWRAERVRCGIQGWRAEFFIPYALLRPLQNVPPKAGTKWRANFYRMDYDDGKTTQWDWARVGPSFHEFEKFGELTFVDK